MKLYGMVWKNWDLQPVQLHYFGFCLGAGFTISTPLFYLKYGDENGYRCLQVIVTFMGLNFCAAIPLWEEADHAIVRR